MEEKQVTLETLHLKIEHFMNLTRDEFERGRVRFERMEEKIDCVREDMSTTAARAAVIEDKVNRVHKTVHEDNGQPALVTRFVRIEEEVKVHATAIASVKTWVENEGTQLVAKTNLKIESTKARWAFWGIVIVGVLTMIGTLIASLATYFK
jgi:hypothetical protein